MKDFNMETDDLFWKYLKKFYIISRRLMLNEECMVTSLPLRLVHRTALVAKISLLLSKKGCPLLSVAEVGALVVFKKILNMMPVAED